ncbi:MAG TPA: hypothetical protein VGM76_04945 [Lacipirellulaceae bacterium]|jgi:hypothetical protein
MSYRVIWSPFAEDWLELFLSNAAERANIAAAAKDIDQQLIADPTALGESRYDEVRIGFVRPLGVQFEVLEDVRMVVVHDVWRIDWKH